MRIYSWNALIDNEQLDRAAEWIAELEFDVLCLQEVSKEFLERLSTLDMSLVSTLDFEDTRGKKGYLAILSRLPVLEERVHEIPRARRPLRTKLFMSLMGWSPVVRKQSIAVDVEYEGRTVSICNAHVTLHGPDARERELTAAFTGLDAAVPSICAGDFNIIESWPIKILNWLMGAPLSHGMPWYSERARFERFIAAQGLRNPLRGHITHPFSRSQLDHILISQHFTVHEAAVGSDAHGSDHQPVRLTLSL